MKPEEIEKRSFEIIESELKHPLNDKYKAIIKRVIHTTADFEYAESLLFSADAVEAGREAIKAGLSIITDTNMAKSGISSKSLARFGGDIKCFIADSDVAETAKRGGITRAQASMDKAAALGDTLIFAIGNAPTALIRLCELIQAGTIKPALVIGVPVGFVNVVESKEMLMALDVPYIVSRGRKGGSTVAAAICNALLYGIQDGE